MTHSQNRWPQRLADVKLVAGVAILSLCAGVTSGCAQSDSASSAFMILQEQTVGSPGGAARIQRWTAPGESQPRVVKAVQTVSGLGLADGISLVYHAANRRWMLSLDGRLVELSSITSEPLSATPLPVGMGDRVLWQGQFTHRSRSWHIAITRLYEPVDVPGVATEAENALDLVMW